MYNLHTTLLENQTLIKSLIAKRNDAIRATNNLITAIEQGIITEQTKARLKELETQISQYEFDIEQEKQRNYTYLTPDKIRDYLQSIIKGDICNINIQKEIVKLFIREIIYDNKAITIVYNFADKNLTRKQIPDKIDEVMEQSEMTAFNIKCGSSKHHNSAPEWLKTKVFSHFLYVFL